jgi:2-aminobenzoate-CoA ligase
VCAFIVLKGGVVGDDALVKNIQEYVKATMAPYKYPREIRFVEQLPRNTSGKLQHFVLRRQLEDELRAAAEDVAS